MGATYTSYTNLNTPNEVITKMRDFIVDKGYNIIQDLTDDLDIYDHTITDGKKFSFFDKSVTYAITLRSQNGYNIFGLNNESAQDSVSKEENTDDRFSGVGMIVSSMYENNYRWYNQKDAPVVFNEDSSVVRDVLGVYMPVSLGERIPEVQEPEEVEEPEEVPEPEPPNIPVAPTPPTAPTRRIIPEPERPKDLHVHFIGDEMTLSELYREYVQESPDGVSVNEMNSRVSTWLASPGIAIYNTDSSIPDNSRQSIFYPSNYLAYAIVVNGVQYVPIASNVTGLPMSSIQAVCGIRYSSNDANSQPLKEGTRWPRPSDILSEYELPYTTTNPPTRFDAVISDLGTTQLNDIIHSPIIKDSFYYGITTTGVPSHPAFTRSSYVQKPLLKRHSTQGTYWWYRGWYSWIKLSVLEDGINYQRNLDDWINQRGQEWDAYRAQQDQADAEYEQALSIYESEYASYLSAMQEWQALSDSMNSDYNSALEVYSAYLVAKQTYEDYLVALQAYLDYLALLAETRYYYTLYCNEVLLDNDPYVSTIVFSLVKERDDYYQVSHLIVGNLLKYGNWDGGIIFSGSANRYNMIESIDLYEHEKTSDSVIYPVLSSGNHTNSFLRINIGSAYNLSRGHILWASSGSDNITGKPMSLPIRTGDGTTAFGNGVVPHYYFIQSHDRLDSGRNLDTMNCVTVNLPIRVAVRVDPDALNNYAAAGEVLGVYFVSMYNIQTASVYDVNYPLSNNTCQAFSVGKRRGVYGFDGISVKQMDDF